VLLAFVPDDSPELVAAAPAAETASPKDLSAIIVAC